MGSREKVRSLFLWLLLKEPDQAYVCAGDLGLIQWSLLIGSIPVLALVFGVFWFQVLVYYGPVAFGLYYVGAIYLAVQWLHFATRRR